MELLKTSLGGLIEGLASALPLSASAHRLMFEKISQKTLPAGLELAVAAAILLLFYKTAWECIKSIGKMITDSKNNKFRWRKASRYQKMAVYAPIAAAPYWILTFLQKQYGFLEGVGESLLLVGFLLIANAGVLFLADHSIEKNWDLTDLTFGQAVKLGLFQGASLLPGFSRTAMTFGMARNMGFKAWAALEFSMMTAIPALIGKGLMSMDWTMTGRTLWVSLAAVFLGALGGLSLLKVLVKKENVSILMFYSAAFGVAAMVLNFI